MKAYKFIVEVDRERILGKPELFGYLRENHEYYVSANTYEEASSFVQRALASIGCKIILMRNEVIEFYDIRK